MATDPAAQFVAATRLALSLSGLTRREAEESVYFIGGAGRETLVLVHGVNDQAGTWAAVVPMLAARFHLIIPDLAGHGESAPSEGPIEMNLIVERLHAIIDREVRGTVTLVGNSMGGWVSILYALAHHNRVARLVLESGGGLAMPLATSLVAQTREEAMRILHAVHGPAAVLPDWAVDALLQRATSSPMLRLMQGGVFGHFVDGRLSEIDVPTTIVWGSDDGVVPRAYVEALHRGIGGSTLQVIEGAAHIPHVQKPERFVSCLMETFSANERA